MKSTRLKEYRIPLQYHVLAIDWGNNLHIPSYTGGFTLHLVEWDQFELRNTVYRSNIDDNLFKDNLKIDNDILVKCLSISDSYIYEEICKFRITDIDWDEFIEEDDTLTISLHFDGLIERYNLHSDTRDADKLVEKIEDIING